MKKLILAFALIAPMFSAPLFAAERVSVTHVAYADLRLSDPDGRERLDRRISHAIEKACAVDPQALGLADRRAAQACVRAKRAEVAPQRAAALASRGVPVQVAAANR
jgi:UrcA family protein